MGDLLLHIQEKLDVARVQKRVYNELYQLSQVSPSPDIQQMLNELNSSLWNITDVSQVITLLTKYLVV